jgi:hypothetical protein
MTNTGHSSAADDAVRLGLRLDRAARFLCSSKLRHALRVAEYEWHVSRESVWPMSSFPILGGPYLDTSDRARTDFSLEDQHQFGPAPAVDKVRDAVRKSCLSRLRYSTLMAAGRFGNSLGPWRAIDATTWQILKIKDWRAGHASDEAAAAPAEFFDIRVADGVGLRLHDAMLAFGNTDDARALEALEVAELLKDESADDVSNYDHYYRRLRTDLISRLAEGHLTAFRPEFSNDDIPAEQWLTAETAVPPSRVKMAGSDWCDVRVRMPLPDISSRREADADLHRLLTSERAAGHFIASDQGGGQTLLRGPPPPAAMSAAAPVVVTVSPLSTASPVPAARAGSKARRSMPRAKSGYRASDLLLVNKMWAVAEDRKARDLPPLGRFALAAMFVAEALGAAGNRQRRLSDLYTEICGGAEASQLPGAVDRS